VTTGNPDVDELIRYNSESAERCPAVSPGGVACAVEVSKHASPRWHENGDEVWESPPECETCDDLGRVPVAWGCFGPNRWDECPACRRRRIGKMFEEARHAR
jgi:hypothetical protein